MHPQSIILVGGHTTGHILPMLAVGAEFRSRPAARDVVVLGDASGPEALIVPEYGFPFRAIGGAPLRGVRAPVQRLRACAATASSFLQLRGLFARTNPALVAGFGGYVSAAPVLAARSLGIPTAIFEPNAVPGLANRRLRAVADLRIVGLRATATLPGWGDAIVSGHPIREDVLRARTARRRAAGTPLRFLVTGGLRGSRFLNAAAPATFAEIRAGGVDLQVHHQSGCADTEAIAAAYARYGIAAAVEPFIGDMGAAFAACDAALCAGGAGTLSELAALGIPALVVPIGTAADDHQTANAHAFAAALRSVCIGERDWDAASAARVLLQLAASEPAQAATPNAAAAFVDSCERTIVRRSGTRVRLRVRDPIEFANS